MISPGLFGRMLRNNLQIGSSISSPIQANLFVCSNTGEGKLHKEIDDVKPKISRSTSHWYKRHEVPWNIENKLNNIVNYFTVVEKQNNTRKNLRKSLLLNEISHIFSAKPMDKETTDLTYGCSGFRPSFCEQHHRDDNSLMTLTLGQNIVMRCR